MIKYAVKMLKNKFYPLVYPEGTELESGQYILVQTEKGEEAVRVFLVNSEIAKHWEKFKPQPLNLVRVMSKEDIAKLDEIKKEEYIAFNKCKALVAKHKLSMNLVQSRYTFDMRKITFYYTAQERVDFRELLKDLTQTFKRVRIDLRHIGVRDETSIVEGNGLCGKPFCCCSWLRKFDSINIKLAKDQGMPITPGKISGTCGRLLCCLNYEYKDYIDAAKEMPPVGCGVMTADGLGRVCSINFLSEKISVKLEDGKIKDYPKDELEMVDTKVDIDIENVGLTYPMDENDAKIDIRKLEDDRNSTTGNV
ncbi:stage 0 sporulation protein [bacterium]|nr:stage 0 sporulation protein [bacterium]